MKTSLRKDHVGAALMGIAVIWSIVAPWLSANNVITVWAELSTRWLLLLVLLFGASAHLGNLSRPWPLRSFFCRCVAATFALMMFVAMWFLSDKAFLYWKMRAIPPEAWVQMVSDVEKVGRQSAESGTNCLSGTMPPPKSLQRLGLAGDYGGGSAQFVSRPEYTGLVVSIDFGYKVRGWGLFVGPEKLAKGHWPGFERRRVGTNAFFFIGSRG
jgi:hypothetical protein